MSVREISGIASWYDDGRGGLRAAAGPALQVGDWRGRTVEVCRADAPRGCVAVTLNDWCQCYAGTRTERIIDLSPAAFRALAPLSRGLVRVEIRG